MNNLVGTWKLEKNVNFGQFLEFFGYNWLRRKAALVSNIDLSLMPTAQEGVYKRKIDSTFMKDEENYIVDGKPYNNGKDLTKIHKVESDMLVSTISGKPNGLKNEIKWTETIQIRDGNMVICRIWDKNGKTIGCRQIFSKRA